MGLINQSRVLQLHQTGILLESVEPGKSSLVGGEMLDTLAIGMGEDLVRTVRIFDNYPLSPSLSYCSRVFQANLSAALSILITPWPQGSDPENGKCNMPEVNAASAVGEEKGKLLVKCSAGPLPAAIIMTFNGGPVALEVVMVLNLVKLSEENSSIT
ncbi:hypothetical protein Tco_0806071 [Tanacetum coccineum]